MMNTETGMKEVTVEELVTAFEGKYVPDRYGITMSMSKATIE